MITVDSNGIVRITDFEQGGIDANGDSNATNVLRSKDYIQAPESQQIVVYAAVNRIFGVMRFSIAQYDDTTTGIPVEINAGNGLGFQVGIDGLGALDGRLISHPYFRIVLIPPFENPADWEPIRNLDPNDVIDCFIDAKAWGNKTWRLEDSHFKNRCYSESVDGPVEKPYPLTMWRIESYENRGKPYHDLLQQTIEIDTKPVPQSPYITIYDKLCDVDDFNTHGLAVLSPTSCEITEELNGKYSLTLEHPIDSDGKWKHIKEFNIIKAMEQLFCIVTVTEQRPGTITATADHIFYNLNDRWIFPKAYMASNSVKGILALGWNASVDFSTTEQKPRVFIFSSDISSQSLISKSSAKLQGTSDGMSFADLVMGSGNVIEMSGGELYRDNFYFSVNERMENSNDNAFEIRVGKDLVGIKRTVDTSQMCTYFRAYYGADKTFGTWFAVSWNEESAALHTPHSIVRSAMFNPTLPPWITDEHPDKDKIYDQLVTDEAMSFFEKNCLPKINYEINLEDITLNDDFAEFTNLPDYRVGNIGTVYDERLGILIKLKITKTVKNAITGKTKSITVTDQFSGEISTSGFVTADGKYFKTADGKRFTTKIGG